MTRALYEARHAGLDATGFVADRRNYGRVMPRLKAREALARVKAFGDVLTGASPKFLGAEIPITGDGRKSLGARLTPRQLSLNGPRDHASADRPRAPRPGDRARRGRARADVSPNPLVGAVIVKDGAGARRGLPRRARRPARRARGDRRLRRRRPARRDDVRLARAVLPHGPHAAVHRRDPRGRASRRVVIASDDPTEKAAGRGPGILRDEGVDVDVRRRRAGRAGAAAQPAVPQARAHGPARGCSSSRR